LLTIVTLYTRVTNITLIHFLLYHWWNSCD